MLDLFLTSYIFFLFFNYYSYILFFQNKYWTIWARLSKNEDITEKEEKYIKYIDYWNTSIFCSFFIFLIIFCILGFFYG